MDPRLRTAALDLMNLEPCQFLSNLTNSMDQSPPWETNRHSAGQEIPSIFWSLEAHYHIYKSLPPVPIRSQINLVQAPKWTSLRYIFILSSHLCLGLPSGPSSSGFSTKTLHGPLPFPMHATCPIHLILLNLIIQPNSWWEVQITKLLAM